MLRMADPIHTAKMFVKGVEVPEHSCQFEMRPLEDATGFYIANADEIAITSKEFHLGFTIKVFASDGQLVWHKDYPFIINAAQTLRLPKHELKIPVSKGVPVRGVG